MIIIGELINTSRKNVAEAVNNRDFRYIQDIARKQVAAGALYVDVNAGTRVKDEVEILPWLVEVVQEAVEVPLCIDSPNPRAIEKALKKHKGRALINSITDEKERFDQIAPLLLEYNARIVALCIDDEIGMPDTADQRLVIVHRLAEKLMKLGVEGQDIFFDPLIKPISVNINFGNEVLETISRIKESYPEVHVTCGLSNISFGLPGRKEVNQAYLVMCMARGMDSAIIDPLDERLMSLLISTRALLGKDRYCREYLKFHRSKKK
jgi:5-methyltetrahydrofolate--homocysteine methyltransferase